MLSDFHFLRPWWLLLLFVVVGAWWLQRLVADPLRGWRKVIEPELLAGLTTQHATDEVWWNWGRLVGWMLAVIALAGPTWRPEPSPFADDPRPLMVLLRAGETSDLEDLMPSRIERARLKITDLAARRAGQPLGLIAYSGSAHLVLPPTRDTAVVATMASEISASIMPVPGDELVTALELAEKTLGDAGGSILVIADTVTGVESGRLREHAAASRFPLQLLAVARDETPELKAIQEAAKDLQARVTVMTPDSTDVETIIRRAAQAPQMMASEEEGVRWQEAGWWIVPVLSGLALLTFRREDQHDGEGNPS